MRLKYAPTEVTVTGKLVVVKEFGPPNWGENPKTDMKLRVPVLRLSHPIDVEADPKSEFNDQSYEDIKEIQLKEVSDYEQFLNKDVVVTGKLSQGLTGWDFTNVLISVKTITLRTKGTSAKRLGNRNQ
jgi:hypothetical protein